MSFYSVLVYVKDEPTRQFILEERRKSEVCRLCHQDARTQSDRMIFNMLSAFGHSRGSRRGIMDILRTIFRQNVTYIDNKSISNQRNQKKCLLMLVDIG